MHLGAQSNADIKRKDDFMKKLVFAVTVLFASFLIVSCSGTKDDTLVIWAWNNSVDILRDAVERYQNDVDSSFKAEVVDFSKADINTKISTSSALQDSSDMADIILGDWIYMRSNYELFPELFANLSNNVTEAQLEAFPDFSTEVVKNADNELYALPFGIGPTVTFVYKPLIDEVVDADTYIQNVRQNGWTWDDYISLGKLLNQENSEYSMSAYNLSGDDRIFRTLVSQKGYWFMDREQNVTINNQFSQDALNKLSNMYNDNVVTHVDSGDYKSLMVDGKLAAQIQGFWLSGQIKDLAPEQSGDWAILPCPSWDLSEPGDSVTGGSYLYVNNASSHKQEAIDFMIWQTMNVDNVIRALQVGGIFPVLEAAYSDDRFIAEDSYFGNGNYLLDVANIVTSAKPIYPSKYNSFNYDTYISAQYNVLFNDSDVVSELNNAAVLMLNNKDG